MYTDIGWLRLRWQPECVCPPWPRTAVNKLQCKVPVHSALSAQAPVLGRPRVQKENRISLFDISLQSLDCLNLVVAVGD